MEYLNYYDETAEAAYRRSEAKKRQAEFERQCVEAEEWIREMLAPRTTHAEARYYALQEVQMFVDFVIECEGLLDYGSDDDRLRNDFNEWRLTEQPLAHLAVI